MAMPLWLKEKLFQKSLLIDLLRAEAPRCRLGEEAALHRAPREPCGERVLSIAVQRGRDPHHGRRRRVGDDQHGRRHGQPALTERGDSFPAFARAAVFRLHLLHRLQGQFRRIQGDGPRALWRAEIRAGDHGQSDRHPGGRLVPHEHGLFRLLHRPDDDERRSSTRCSAGRRASRKNCSPSARWISPRRSRR